jgi:hypothetical protein
MKPKRRLTDEELIERGLEALMKALGPVETTRFLSLGAPGGWSRSSATAAGRRN